MSKLKFLLLACIAAGSFLTPNTEAAPNSVVRFRISYGYTKFADIDVELFDDAKPITVSNFLYQVQTGSYDRSFLHRVVPGFVLQGGLYTVTNPYPSTFFEAMTRIPEGPPITNEFNVGPRIGNTFGTLAMALSSTNIGGNDYPLLDTATASWFFNIVDNTIDLDPNYCVFGRVKAGASKLNFFNTLFEDEGIINMVPDILNGTGFSWLFSGCNEPLEPSEGLVALNSLPVAYFFFDCPYYSDLFNVQISMISGRDVAPPTFTVAPIGVKQTISNDTHTVSGTVKDNVGVEQVRVYLGAGSPMTADLNTNNKTWSVTLTNITPGTNLIYVEATDTSGNRATKPVSFFYSKPLNVGMFLGGTSEKTKPVVMTNFVAEVTTNIVGMETNYVTNLVAVVVTNDVSFFGGTIQGGTNGQPFEIGRTFILTAKPAPGNLFAGWREGGNLIWLSPTYPIFIDPSQTNRDVTAVFNTNLFPYVKGTYTGLFCDTNQVEEWNSGFFTLTVGDVGTYSAKAMINNKTFPLAGTFDSGNGTALNFIFPDPHSTSNDLTVRLNLDLIPGNDHLYGSFSNRYVYLVSVTVTNDGIETNIVTRYTNQWVSELHAYRPTFATTNPAPQAGKYTLIIPADPISSNGPFGDGYGTVSVSTKGSLTFGGCLADGTKVTQKAFISRNGDWPLYLNLYKGKGTLLSRLVFDTNQPDTDVSGLMNWFKRTQVAKYFGAGFTNESMIVGSRFIAPTGTNRLLELTTGVVGFTNGNLVADFANNVTVDAPGKVTNLDAGINRLVMSLNKASGLMSGSVTPPGATRAIPFKGALLQKQNRGSGYFLGTNASGRISLGQ